MQVLPRAFTLALVLGAPACTFECNAESCADGCCESNVCYEGGSIKRGATCSGGTGGGGGSGGGGGGGTCLAEHAVCRSGTCCATNATGKAMSCNLNICQPSCGSSSAPCNASLPCCKSDVSFTYSYICVSERCEFCLNKGHECRTSSSSTPCCPGSTCLLKPGFSTVYECQ